MTSRGLSFLLCYFCLFFFETTCAQQFYTLSTEDGLPSNSVWRVTQDVQGRLWFGTTNGLVRYDGKNLVSMGVEDGMLSESNTSLLWKNDSTLLVGSYRKGLNIVNTNSFEVERTVLADRIGENLIMHDGRLYDVLAGANAISAKWPELNFERPKFMEGLEFRPNAIARYKNELVGIQAGQLLRYGKDSHEPFFNDPTESSLVSINVRGNGNWLGGVGYIAEFNEEGLFNKIVDGIPPDGKVHRVWERKNGQIYLSIINYGLYLLENGKARPVGEDFGIGTIGINFFFEDRESNLWILTYGKGVICIPKGRLIESSVSELLSSNEINDFQYHDSLGMLVASSIGLFAINAEGIDSIPAITSAKYTTTPGFGNTYVSRLELRSNGDVLAESPSYPENFGQVKYNDFTISYQGKWYLNNSTNQTLLYGKDPLPHVADPTIPIRENSLLGEYALMYLDGYAVDFYLSEPTPGSATFIDNIGRIWHEQDNRGLCRSTVVNDGINNISTETMLKGAVFYSTIEFNNRQLVGTSFGLYEYDGKDFYRSELSKQLLDAKVKDMVVDNQNRLWVATNNGLICIDGELTSSWYKADGLNSNQLNAVGYDPKKNLLYVGSDAGMSIIYLSDFLAAMKEEVPLIFTEFASRGVVIENHQNIDLKPESNDVSISYSSLDYSKKTGKRFQYRLNGSQKKEWRNTTNTTIEFNSLQSDDYAFEVRPILSNGQPGKISTVNFTIDKVFWKKGIFYLGLAALTFLILSIVLNRRLKLQQRDQDKERAVEKKIKSLEYQALSAMMNPHFIFNSLNSIQYFYNSKDLRSANEYLAQFARLIRMNLNLADQPTVALEDELDRLDLYLKLEQMRLGDIFDYEFVLHPEVETDSVFVPSMLIQPYVENAIFHGIRMNEKHGRIEIEVEPFPEDYITISIVDNGIGINQSKALKAKSKNKADHESKSMRINAERIEIIGKDHGLSQLKIQEIVAPDGTIGGTEVKIIIPDEFE